MKETNYKKRKRKKAAKISNKQRVKDEADGKFRMPNLLELLGKRLFKARKARAVTSP